MDKMGEKEKLADAIHEIDHLIENWRVETIAAALTRTGWRHLPLDGPEFEAMAWRAAADMVRDRADWLVDAVATSTQDRRYLRGDPECDHVACDAIRMNGEKAIRAALRAAVTGARAYG